MRKRRNVLAPAFVLAALSLTYGEEDQRTASGIQDNSFFIEEAYNREAGVVQHILATTYSVTQHARHNDEEWAPVFTQEWPIGSQTHQFSYTIPYSFVQSGGQSRNGIGDVLINYRLQALTETSSRPAFAPRLSLILPTGDETRGFGSGVFGFQTNLPMSKIVSDRWTLHLNAGFTFLPDVQGRDLVNYNFGGSAIFAVDRRFNLMLECVANVDEEPDSHRTSSVILSPGARYAFNFKNGAQVVLGIAAPIGLTAAAPDYGAVIYLSVEHSFAR